MADAQHTDGWRSWFATEEAKPTKTRLQTIEQIKPPDIAGLGQNTIRELASIKTSGKHQLTEANLSDYLGSLTLEDLQGHVAAEAKLLGDAHAEWDQKRNVGWRGVRTSAQEFTVTFDRFLSSFSGIVEVARMADDCYGGAATRIMSLFYAVVKIKADNDEAILLAMRTIADRLPDARIYEQVYADNTLAMMLAEAYRGVLIFAKKATAYFQGRGISRTLKSIKNPVKFPDMSESLVQNFTAIRIRAEALLSQRVAYLAVQNIELLSQVKLLTDGQNNDRVRRLQKLLERHPSHSKEARDGHLDEYRRFLPPVAEKPSRRLRQLSLQDLQGLPQYQTWTAMRSSMLFLHGCNHEFEHMPQSWLSFAVVDLITQLQQDTGAETLVAYEMCSPEKTTRDLAKSLISQLLDLRPAVLSEAEDQREIELRISRNQDSQLAGKPEHEPLGDYAWVLRRIIDRCDLPVYLVLNRPEVCQGDELWDFIKHLLELIRDAKNPVKVLIVVKSEEWSIKERLQDLDKRVLDANELVVLRQDQTRVYEGRY
ncbi:hypothetical protein B0T16DRAFT_388472 [Cercophora newfieldiana]|uniref:DUF7708 domain-containing protein n=1 Tax=Cercophora newfieldiana TaxID=92897 RepID=A0AA40CSW9_9PEZI|nr:hypothetical protein B0T16DRAFT_388472 [Cercophora newfieldiana]